MTLEELLQLTNARVTVSDKGLYYDELMGEWVVLSRPYGKKKTSELYRGHDLFPAVAKIVEGELNEP